MSCNKSEFVLIEHFNFFQMRVELICRVGILLQIIKTTMSIFIYLKFKSTLVDLNTFTKVNGIKR